MPLPKNSVGEIMRMCEDADLKDLMIIMDHFDEDKHLYTVQEANDILKFIDGRRRKIEMDCKWKEAKSKLGL